MIIENAFLKLPELLTSSYNHRDTFEATVVHLMAVAILMELNSRNVPRYFEHVKVESPFPNKKGEDNIPLQADLYVNLEKATPVDGRMAAYGARQLNWIEVKAYLSSTRKGSTPTKTVNVGKVIRDLLRLCLLPEELPGAIRQNGRYLLIVSSNHPFNSLAVTNRPWLSQLLAKRHSEVDVTISGERDSLLGAIGPGFLPSSDIRFNIGVHTRFFEPYEEKPPPLFWGYLLKVKHFRIDISGVEIYYRDVPGEHLDEDFIQRLNKVRSEVLKRIKGNS